MLLLPLQFHYHFHFLPLDGTEACLVVFFFFLARGRRRGCQPINPPLASSVSAFFVCLPFAQDENANFCKKQSKKQTQTKVRRAINAANRNGNLNATRKISCISLSKKKLHLKLI